MKKTILFILTVSVIIFSLNLFTFAQTKTYISDAQNYKTENLSGNNLAFSAKITGGKDITFNISIDALEKFYYDSDIRYYTFTFNNLTVRADKNNFFDFDLNSVDFSLTENSFDVVYNYNNGSCKNLTNTMLDLRYTLQGKKFESHTVAIMNNQTVYATSCESDKFVFTTNALGKFSVRTFEFTDVTDKKAWYYEYVNKAGAYGIISGVGDGSFVPTRNVTRAELATLMVEATKHIIEYNVKPDIRFSDVSDGAWYSQYVYKCASAGLMSGVGDGKFNPTATATRQEIAELTANLVRLLGGYSGKALPDMQSIDIDAELAKIYSDASSVHNWAKESVLLCNMLEIMQGSDGAFSPLRNITRAESAKIFNDLYFNAVI